MEANKMNWLITILILIFGYVIYHDINIYDIDLLKKENVYIVYEHPSTESTIVYQTIKLDEYQLIRNISVGTKPFKFIKYKYDKDLYVSYTNGYESKTEIISGYLFVDDNVEKILNELN